MDLKLTTRSTATLRITLGAGVTIPSGSVVGSSSTGAGFKLEKQVTNGGASGDVFAKAISIFGGDIEAPAGDLTVIRSPIAGWVAVTNDFSASLPGDLDFSTGDLELVTDTAAIIQEIGIRLRFFKGEWFLNTLLGMPYFEDFFVKAPKIPGLRAILKEAMSETPGVQRVEKLELVFNKAAREMTANIEIIATSGELLTFTENFIVGV